MFLKPLSPASSPPLRSSLSFWELYCHLNTKILPSNSHFPPYISHSNHQQIGSIFQITSKLSPHSLCFHPGPSHHQLFLHCGSGLLTAVHASTLPPPHSPGHGRVAFLKWKSHPDTTLLKTLQLHNFSIRKYAIPLLPLSLLGKAT